MNKDKDVRHFTKKLSKARTKLIACHNCQITDADLLQVDSNNDASKKICLKHQQIFQTYLAANAALADLPRR